MPIYEFRCNSCGHVTSVLVRSFAESPKPVCEECRGIDMTRRMSRPAIIRSHDRSQAGTLRVADPRRTVEQMGDMYDQKGVDPGAGFREVVSRAAAGDSPQELKEAINHVRKKEAAS